VSSGDDDAAARIERARRLRERIEQERVSGERRPRRPVTPRDFIEEKMREERERTEENGDDRPTRDDDGPNDDVP
jgi:hypothetical protein